MKSNLRGTYNVRQSTWNIIISHRLKVKKYKPLAMIKNEKNKQFSDIIDNMKSKKDKALEFLKKNDNILLCPVCDERLFANDDYTLKCVNNHSYDISKKGVINLSGKSNEKIYDSSLFVSRRAVIMDGLYEPLTDEIARIIKCIWNENTSGINILDAGCGEGSFLNNIGSNLYKNSDKLNNINKIGIDLSKQGVDLASDYTDDSLWLVGDIANTHLNSNSVDVILNILSPANYNEFKRLLADGGIVIKVIPGPNYLKEFRQLLRENDSNLTKKVNDEGPDNSGDSLAHSEKEMEILNQYRVNYKLSLNETEYNNMANMTPLTHGKYLSTDAISNSGSQTTFEITIDLQILVGRI